MANLRDEYKQHIHNTAPDMDKLWNRISEEIDKTENSRETEATYAQNRGQIKSSAGYMRIAAAAAAFIVVFAGINIFSESQKAKTAKDNFPSSRTEKTESDKDSNEENDAWENIDTDDYHSDEMNPAEQIVKYEQLSFNDTDTISYMANYTPQGDEFFVEKNVLAQTSFFADVTVLEADLYDSEGAVYTLQVNALYGKDGELMSDDIVLISSTPYILQENREYLIPLGYENGGYFIVFENAPQIEITLDGGMVFQNGWSTLVENSLTLEKDSLNVNDFYFDRMKYSPTSDLELLLTEWKQA